MESDEERFGGHRRLDDAHGRWYESHNQQCDNRPNSIKIYLPSRTCIILCAYENAIKIKDSGTRVTLTLRKAKIISKLNYSTVYSTLSITNLPNYSILKIAGKTLRTSVIEIRRSEKNRKG